MTGENHPLGSQIGLKTSTTRINNTRFSFLVTLDLVNQKIRNTEEVTIF